ncbi:MAG TPA: MBL fold metallo-hydrolase [Gammaproteobacteria bacterium]|nr:MBL fold metallo-hydrolase [Gammaproteobacteria bacterium]
MDLRSRRSRNVAAGAASALLAVGFLAPALAQPSGPPPLIKQDAAIKVSDHVFVILDDNVGFVPNVGIVVGDRATLIVDTGLGERNGAIVLAEARKLSDNTDFYLTATHFHPEHDLGATAFPDDAKMVRWREQQAEADEVGAQTIERFKAFSPMVAELLAGSSFRPVDTLFDQEHTVDLGGVRVRIIGAGPNHTRGDTVMFVVEDRVLFTGDVVMAVFPSASAAGSVDKWLANLAAYDALAPAVVVPAHGRLGDVNFVRSYRDYFSAVRERTRAAKSAGQPLEAAQAALAPAIAAQFTDLAPAAGPPTGRINAAIAAAYREAP